MHTMPEALGALRSVEKTLFSDATRTLFQDMSEKLSTTQCFGGFQAATAFAARLLNYHPTGQLIGGVACFRIQSTRFMPAER